MTFNDVDVLWRAQPTYIIVQVLCLVGGLITFLHGNEALINFIHVYVHVVQYVVLRNTNSSFFSVQTKSNLIERRKNLSSEFCSSSPINSHYTGKNWIKNSIIIRLKIQEFLGLKVCWWFMRLGQQNQSSFTLKVSNLEYINVDLSLYEHYRFRRWTTLSD